VNFEGFFRSVRCARMLSFTLMVLPVAGSTIFFVTRFGRKRRWVLRFEWLTLWPVCGLFPVNAQTFDIRNC